MSDIREALAALLEREFGQFLAHRPHDPERFYGTAANAILAAGWTPPTVKPTLEQVVDALAAQPPGSAEWTSSRIMQTARAVLALLPGRSEAEVKAEALREAASAIGTYDEGDVHLWARDADTWLLDRADRIEKEADDDR